MKLRQTMCVVLLLALLLSVPALAADALPVTIDGYADDWTDKPMTRLSLASQPGEDKITTASVFSDDAFLYIYLKNCPNVFKEIRELNFFVQINDEEERSFKLNLPTKDDGSYFTVTTGIDEEGLGIYRAGWEPETEWAELSIPLSFLTDHAQAVDQIVLRIPSWGDQVIPLSGISTAPWIGLGLCIVAAVGFALFQNYRTKKAKKTV